MQHAGTHVNHKSSVRVYSLYKTTDNDVLTSWMLEKTRCHGQEYALHVLEQRTYRATVYRPALQSLAKNYGMNQTTSHECINYRQI